MKILESFLHIVELFRELMRPGELREWRRIDPRDEAKLLSLPVPASANSYPYHQRLDREQVLYEDDLF